MPFGITFIRYDQNFGKRNNLSHWEQEIQKS